MGFRNLKGVVDAYGLNPQSALPRNQLFWSRDLTKVDSAGVRGWQVNGTATRPSATTLNTPANNDWIYQRAVGPHLAGKKITVSALLSGSGTTTLRASTSSAVQVGLPPSGALETSSTLVTLTGTPTKYSVTLTLANYHASVLLVLGRAGGTETATTVTATDFQLEFSAAATEYQFTGASLAYDDPVESGRHHYQRVFRSTNIYQITGGWADFGMSAGSPKYNAYVGSQLEATPLVGAGNNGIYTGPTPPTGMTKHIAKIAVGTMSTTVPIQRAMLMDYLMFYPLIDGDSTDLQEMINTEALPRYSEGVGVQMMLVMTGGSSYSGAYVTINYTNSDGVSGRLINHSVQAVSLSSIAGHNTVWSLNALGHRFSLQGQDRGVRSVQSIQFSAGTGMFLSLVLCKPICDIQMLESTTVAEIDYINQRLSLPEVKNGAYLNFICHYGATASSTLPLHAGIDFIWS